MTEPKDTAQVVRFEMFDSVRIRHASEDWTRPVSTVHIAEKQETKSRRPALSVSCSK